MSFLNQFLIVSPLFLFTFFAFVILALVIDFIALKKQGNHQVNMKEAVTWSIIWVIVALIFNIGLWMWFNHYETTEIANVKATEFFIAYIVEKSLSVDNLFIFLIVFGALGLKGEFQNKVLLIGIGGAIILRTIMIFIGIWLINEFSWILYVFGAILLLTGIKMLWTGFKKDDVLEEETPAVMRWLIKLFPMSSTPSEKFWVKENGKLLFTTVFVAAVTISIVDIIFAVDSIPAVIAISKDPYIVLTSNILALLGMRALYFVLADLKERFWALGIGLGVVLAYIGMKMLLVDFIHINPFVSLLVIIGIITASIVYSLKHPNEKQELEIK